MVAEPHWRAGRLVFGQVDESLQTLSKVAPATIFLIFATVDADEAASVFRAALQRLVGYSRDNVVAIGQVYRIHNHDSAGYRSNCAHHLKVEECLGNEPRCCDAV